MGIKDPRVDAYIAKSADFAKPIMTHLRKLIHDNCPTVEETIKWSFPHFTYKSPGERNPRVLCSMAFAAAVLRWKSATHAPIFGGHEPP